MTSTPRLSLPPDMDPDAVLARLDRVLDPELDESVVSLGFVEEITSDHQGNLTVSLRLPTYWCAANFSYLMADDARRALLTLDGVHSVTVRLGEHFAGSEVERGTRAASTFGEAFPAGGPDTIEETRQIFLRKGFFARQERLLRALKDAGLSFAEIASLHVGDVPSVVDARTVARYQERCEELGVDTTGTATLIVDLSGNPIPPERLETWYHRARTTRLAMEASGSLCSAMLESRSINWTTPSS